MIFNRERRFIFIEVPKTGTSAIAKRLLEIDPGCVRNRILTECDEEFEVPVHATVGCVRRLLGPEAEKYSFVAFLRDPVDVMISKYHFYRAGRAAMRAAKEGDDIGRRLRVAFAQRLPLVLWCAVYPFKESAHFVTQNGIVAVDFLGDFSRLQAEFIRLFKRFGYSDDDLVLSVENRTVYPNPSGAELRWIEWIAEAKCRQDRRLYTSVADGGQNGDVVSLRNGK